jgi:hypothetical protein
VVAAALWFVAVLAVKVLVSPSSLGDHVQGPGKAGQLAFRRNGKDHIIFLHQSLGNAAGFEAWHKAALVLILVTLAALAVAGIDSLRRTVRRSRRARTATSDAARSHLVTEQSTPF